MPRIRQVSFAKPKVFSWDSGSYEYDGVGNADDDLVLLITITIYEPDPAQPFHSVERILAKDVFTSADNDRKEITVQAGATQGPFFTSVKLRTTYQPLKT